MPEVLKTLLWLLLGMAIGGGLGWYFTRKAIQKQLKENPPVNEKMISAMLMKLGRKPSEAQIKDVMKSLNQYQ